MRRLLLLVICLGVALFFGGFSPAFATVNDQGWTRTFETFGPDVVDDLFCQEGKPYLATGSEEIRIHFVAADEGFHFSVWETHEMLAVPVDGTGPTYVESGNVDRAAGYSSLVNGVFVFNHMNTDSFVAYQDGKLDASATVRIHELEQFVGFDTDGDGLPDVVRVEFQKSRFSDCP